MFDLETQNDFLYQHDRVSIAWTYIIIRSNSRRFFITASIYKCTHQNRIASMLFPKGTEKLKASSITNLIRQAQKERRRNEGQMSVMKQRQWSDGEREREMHSGQLVMYPILG